MSLEIEEMDNISPLIKGGEIKRSCLDCNTTRTPCWRGGPAGPRTLCNACGIRYRKKSRAVLGLDKGQSQKSRITKIAKSSSSGNSNNGKSSSSSRSKFGVPLRLGLMGLGRDTLLRDEWKRKLGEEEQAAILLMALSCGSVYA